MARKVATQLSSDLGFSRGTRVLLFGANSPAWVAIFLGIIWAGGVAVPVNPALTERELLEAVASSSPSFAFIDNRLFEKDRSFFSVIAGRHPFVYGADGLEFLSCSTGLMDSEASTRDTEAAALLFTSGTSGKAKTVIYSNRDLLIHADLFGTFVAKIRSTDAVVTTTSFSFVHGLVNGLCMPLRCGGTGVIHEIGSLHSVLPLIERAQITVMVSVPKALRALAVVGAHYNLSTLRLTVSSGERLTVDDCKAWSICSHGEIHDVLGSTELGVSVLISTFSNNELFSSFLPGYETTVNGVVNPPIGTFGGLAVRGPTGCKYLYNQEAQNERVISGWTSTGDCIAVGANGPVFFSRLDDIINIDGYKVAPQEIEQVYRCVNGISDCAASLFVENGQSKIALHCVFTDLDLTKANFERLRFHGVENLAPHKRPARFISVANVPRSSNGKIRRFLL